MALGTRHWALGIGEDGRRKHGKRRKSGEGKTQKMLNTEHHGERQGGEVGRWGGAEVGR